MIIGLNGYARSGKDEAAKGLMNVGWERRAFADKVRDFLYALNPMCFVEGQTVIFVQDVIDTYGWNGYKDTIYGGAIRHYMQRAGTEAGRKVLYENVWVDATLNDETEKKIVVTDCRFPNEAQAIKDRGGVVVRINRPGVGPANNHPSETGLDDWSFDYTITNDGSIRDLHDWVTNIAFTEAFKLD